MTNHRSENQHKETQRMLFYAQDTEAEIDDGEVVRMIAYGCAQPVDATD